MTVECIYLESSDTAHQCGYIYSLSLNSLLCCKNDVYLMSFVLISSVLAYTYQFLNFTSLH